MIDFIEKRIFLTVDVECHSIEKKNFYIDGKINGQYYGLKKILEIGKELSIPINFFYNFSEIHKYGIDYALEIINLIRSYNQTIFLHVHPSFINEYGKPFFWQYNYVKQKELFTLSFSDFEKILGKMPTAFRAGGYGVNDDTYDALNASVDDKIFDLSYCYGYGPKCKYYNKNHINAITLDRKVTIIPNTRYCGLKIFKYKKYVNFDVACCYKNEIDSVIRENKTNHLVCTMHSWSLMKHFYYREGTLKPDKKNIKNIYYLVNRAKKEGYVFSSLEEKMEMNESPNVDDALIICKKPLKYFISFFNTFFRMQSNARYNKKYLGIYLFFYTIIIIVLLLILFLFICL